MSESGLAEALQGRIEELDARPATPGHHRLSGQRHRGDQGAGHRQGADEAAAGSLLDAEEQKIRRILAEVAGDVVFGVDDEAIEDAVARALRWV